MLKALKIRLYPNATQATQFNKLLGCYRFVYNKCLEKKINSYKENKTSESLTTLGHFFKEHKEVLQYPTQEEFKADKWDCLQIY